RLPWPWATSITPAGRLPFSGLRLLNGRCRCTPRTLAPAPDAPILAPSRAFTATGRRQVSRNTGVHWLRRGSRNRLVHAEGAAFLVNPAATFSCQRRQLRSRRL